MKKTTLAFLFAFGMILTACSPAVKNTRTYLASRTEAAPAVLPPTSSTPVSDTESSWPVDLAALQLEQLSDSMGAVTVTARPVDLDGAENVLRFDVSMNTHSVDLSMDLAALATLSTDNGSTVQATFWDGPRGGHHVSGTLVFPASIDGKSVLDGATTLELILRNIDTPTRTFTWNLPQPVE